MLCEQFFSLLALTHRKREDEKYCSSLLFEGGGRDDLFFKFFIKEGPSDAPLSGYGVKNSAGTGPEEPITELRSNIRPKPLFRRSTRPRIPTLSPTLLIPIRIEQRCEF
jgi:hypothetical protein